MKSPLLPFLLCAALAAPLATQAQDDARSRAILDKMVAKSKTWTSFEADFSSRLQSKRDKLDVKQDGKVTVAGKRFHLVLEDNTIIHDGSAVWTYNKGINEVTISDPADLEEMDPSTVFTMYEKGFKSEFVNERTDAGGVVVQVIKLYPTDAAKKAYHTVVLEVDKNKVEPRQVSIHYKDGNEVTYALKRFQPNVPVDEAMFRFNKARYPGVEVNDMR